MSLLQNSALEEYRGVEVKVPRSFNFPVLLPEHSLMFKAKPVIKLYG
jgi:hypothetical protein